MAWDMAHHKKPQSHRSASTAQRLTALLAVAGVSALPLTVAAQQAAPSIPGLVVAAPSGPAPGPVEAPPGLFVSPPTPTASIDRAAPKPAPKPKPAAAKRPPAKPADGDQARASTRIVALVNDEPITGFAVEQRARFMALSSNIGERARANMQAIAKNPSTNERLKAILEETIKANRGKTREQVIAAFEVRKKSFVESLQRQAVESARSGIIPTLRKDALQELVDERLKLQEGRKLSIPVPESDVDKIFAQMAQRNKMSSAEFSAHIARQGANAEVVKSRLRASLVWREVVRKRYGHQINISQRDIESLAAQAGGDESQELKLQLITIESPGKVDQRAMAARLMEANALRGEFKGCGSMAGLAKGRANAKFQDLGWRKPTSVAEPTRSLLQSAKDGEILPANLSGAGVEIYAVCARRTVKLDDEKRQAAENQLQMKEFEKLALRYLHDLRKDALIEMR
jgi:peptidyl-prolyl cis-trans isomerase SurA